MTDVKIFNQGAATERLAELLGAMGKLTYVISQTAREDYLVQSSAVDILNYLDELMTAAGGVRADMFEIMRRPIMPLNTVWAALTNVPLNTRIRFKWDGIEKQDESVFIGRVHQGRYHYEIGDDGRKPPDRKPDRWAPLE